jgi:hypothetical protein
VMGGTCSTPDGDMNVYRTSVGKREGKRPLGRPGTEGGKL